jgi:guanine deaminase
MMATDYLAEAVRLAVENVKTGGRPFASVIVRDGQIVATGANLSAQSKDPTAHAEIVAIRAACQVLQSESLRGCELYTTCEPCPMCLNSSPADRKWGSPDYPASGEFSALRPLPVGWGAI